MTTVDATLAGAACCELAKRNKELEAENAKMRGVFEEIQRLDQQGALLAQIGVYAYRASREIIGYSNADPAA